MCKFDLITLRWHQQIFQSLPSDTNPQFITSICETKLSIWVCFALSGWHSKQPNNKRVKDWFKKSSAMKHKRKAICEFCWFFCNFEDILLFHGRFFSCSIILGFAQRLSKLLFGSRVLRAVKRLSCSPRRLYWFFLSWWGVKRASWSCVKDSLRVCQVWTKKDYISGQIIATSHDLTPNGGLERESPYFRET